MNFFIELKKLKCGSRIKKYILHTYQTFTHQNSLQFFFLSSSYRTLKKYTLFRNFLNDLSLNILSFYLLSLKFSSIFYRLFSVSNKTLIAKFAQ